LIDEGPDNGTCTRRRPTVSHTLGEGLEGFEMYLETKTIALLAD
jgi:hypothetical protein